MKYTALMSFIVLAIQQQAQAEQDVMVLEPLFVVAGNGNNISDTVAKDRIETANTLGDALDHISGVQNTSFGPNSGAPVIRSLTGNRVGILENGQAVNGMNAISGDINIPFDPLFTHKVIVHKGTNAVRYGGHAIGGSVDIDSGIISTALEDKSSAVELAYRKGLNDFDAHGIRLNINNQKNFSTNLQFSSQSISSYKISGASKASICETDVFPAGGGVNSALADACQKDARISNVFNKAHNQYLDKQVLEHIARDPDSFYDYYDGLESAKYTNDAISKRYVNGKLQTFINDPNPDYAAGTDKYAVYKNSYDVTPNNYKKMSNSYARNQNVALGTTYFLDHGYIGISAGYNTSEYGVPGFSMQNQSFQNSYDDALPVGVKIKQNRIAVEMLQLEPLAWLNSLQLKASRLSNTSGEYIGASNANEYKFDTDAVEVVLEQKPFKRLSGNTGAFLSTRNVNGSGRLRYLPDVKTDSYALFSQQKLDFNPVALDAGYRIEQVKHAVNDQSFKTSRNAANSVLKNKSFDLKSFYIGAEYKPVNDLDFRLQYSHSERAPEINELYASNPHYSIMTQEEGNQALNPEKMNGIELISSLHLDAANVKATLYQMDFENYLYLSHSGASMHNRLPLKYWKQTDTRVNGFELDMDYTFYLNRLGDLKFSLFADLVKNKATDPDRLRLANDGVYLPNMPTNRYGAAVEWNHNSWSARLSNIYYDQPKYLGKNVSEELPLPAYNLLDLNIRRNLKLKKVGVELFINGSNLLNEDARPQNSPLKYIAPLPGRGFQFGVTAHL